jgi:dipeptidyl-peptidase-4
LDRVVTESYPRLAARTQRFTLGIPRNLSVSADGSTVWFIRTPDGLTPTGQLWELDVDSGTETLLVDPLDLLAGGVEELSGEERARRERAREGTAGIVSFDVDATGRWATFALSGKAYGVHLGARAIRDLPTVDGVVDPRLDPLGRHVAYAASGALRVVTIASGEDRALAEPESDTVRWGQAEFIAAEEMDRSRGFWWAPDGRSLLVERLDEAPVALWHLADPADPTAPSRPHRYPAAGTANADVSLWHVSLDGKRTEINWDRQTFEYLARVSWTEHGPPLIQVLSRDQRRSQVLSVEPATGATEVLRELSDDAWVDLGPAPLFAPGGRLVMLEDHRSDRWYPRGIVAVFADSVVATASADPTEVQVVRFGFDGSTEPLTTGAAVHGAVIGGDTTVITRSALDSVGTTVTAHRGESATPLAVVAAPAPFEPRPTFLAAGDRALRTAVLFPRDHVAGTKLPILMDPYGGPHAQRVLASARAFLEPQWLADQGFCVVVADGRGTPGRDAAWERSILHRLADITLEDQIAALEAVAARFPDADTRRVGITGWSYGGYLAALAVLRRPDLFHAAVAGAPVTEWRLYDTCYTERYLGDPKVQPEIYDANSLLPLAPDLARPLMLIHGLADDNVVAAHTLQLSSALLAAGRPHTVLPLSGVTHMTPQHVVAENLKNLQVEFLQRHLG